MPNNVFNQVKAVRLKSNRFDLSHDVKLSFNIGELVPTMCIEAIPGDRFTVSSENLIRFAPLIAPVMHRVRAYTHFFFVPNRILWPHWETFITHSRDGHVVPDDQLPVAPDFAPYASGFDGVESGSVADYLGLPLGAPGYSALRVSALPFAAYARIFSDYYRDENLSTFDPSLAVLADGNQSSSFGSFARGRLLHRAWQHDYFTSALPFAQKGEPVSIAPIQSFDDVNVYFDDTAPVMQRFYGANGALLSPGSASFDSDGIRSGSGSSDGNFPQLDPNGSFKADTSSLALDAITINDLRRASRLQEWLERNARGGSRYIEAIESHFGVRSSDARLNRSEFIGGLSQDVVVSEVLQTSESSDGSPQANMAGHAISVGSGSSRSYFCEEHGFIIGITSILPVTSYQQGVHRMFSRFSSLDYYWPEFAHLGEQEVLNKELYLSRTSLDDGTFGYIPRYSEYKFQNSRVAGDFRTSLDFWHMGRIFDSQPVLNEDFIRCDVDNRYFAVQDPSIQHVYAHVYNRVSALRRMPVFGTPRL